MANLARNSLSARPARFFKPSLLLAGMTLAASAWYVRKKTREAERDYPPQGSFIEVEGVRLHYVEKGEGDPLVLLHGNTTMGMSFALGGLLDMAAEKYRVIVFDRPGYGYSERPRNTIWNSEAQARILHAALEKIGAVRPIVLGHSWGAMVAIAMALNYPDSVRSLVLSSAYLYPTMRPELPFAAQPAIPFIGDIVRYTVSPLLFRLAWPMLLKRQFYPMPVAESAKQIPLWLTLRPDQSRALAAEVALTLPDAMKLSRRYQELQLPIVLIAGSEDRLIYRSNHSDRFHDEVRHSQYKVVEGAGHMVHHIAPERVIEAIDLAVAEDSIMPTVQQSDRLLDLVH